MCQQTSDRLSDRILYGAHGFGVIVAVPWPEESLEPILRPAWHDMQVQMRNALTDAIVHRDEGAGGLHRFLDRRAEQLCMHQKRTGERSGKLRQRLDVRPRYQQAMPRKERPVVQEGERMFVLGNNFGFECSGGDPAEDAIAGHAGMVIRCGNRTGAGAGADRRRPYEKHRMI